MLNDMIRFYVGYALSEITDAPDVTPSVEKTIPERPSIRVPEVNENDISGKIPVPKPETSRQLQEHHDIEGMPSKNYSLEVIVPEIVPLYHGQGELIDKISRKPLTRTYDFKLKTPYTPNLEGIVLESPSIKCYYWGGSNHSVPHITMGEQVLVIHHKGNDTYYWKELGRDNEMRRVEKYRIFVNDQKLVVKTADTANKNVGRVNDDNSYYLEFDTINKHILLSTSNSDGETIRYFMKFNTKTNTFALWDTKGNRFELDSDEHRWYLRNADQSVIDMHRTHVNIWAQDSINLEADHVNCISRVDKSDITGMDPSYKAQQLSARIHQQSRPAPINLGDQLGPGNTKVVYGIPGYHSQVTTNQEVTYVPIKNDWINVWNIINNSYKFTGNISVVKTVEHTETHDVHTYTVMKSALYFYKGPFSIIGPQGIIQLALTNWTGVLKQDTRSVFNKIVAKSIV